MRPTRSRSRLFGPGGRADVIAEVGRSEPGGVVSDLEDAVTVVAGHGAPPPSRYRRCSTS